MGRNTYALKLQNAGDYADFFAKFDRATPVFANEYKSESSEERFANFGTVTSVCSITYDTEIQNGKDIRLELQTEMEQTYELRDFGPSASQKFDITKAGRLQRRNKFLAMANSFWNQVRPF